MEERGLDQYASMLPLEACDALQTSPQGLSDEQVRERLADHGANIITADVGASAFIRLLRSFANWITLILLIAGLLAFLSDTPFLGWAILAIAVLNGLFTTWQEYLAERAIAALRQILPPMSYVRRLGKAHLVPTGEIVPGDLLPLKPGAIVAADSYLISGEGLRVRQTVLTGNAALVTKVAGPMPDPTLAPTERPNILLAGTEIIEGQGSAIVCTTGMRTLLGQIADTTAGLRKEQSPLGRALAALAGTISRVAIVAGAGAFLLTTFGQRLEVREGIIFAIGMIVAFVPEGLLPTVTLALALARRRLQRYSVLVKRLIGVESLGSATVVCIDRTDNLTTGTLAVSDIVTGSRSYRVTGSSYAPQGSFLLNGSLVRAADDPDLIEVLRAAARCTTARLVPPPAGLIE